MFVYRRASDYHDGSETDEMFCGEWVAVSVPLMEVQASGWAGEGNSACTSKQYQLGHRRHGIYIRHKEERAGTTQLQRKRVSHAPPRSGEAAALSEKWWHSPPQARTR